MLRAKRTVLPWIHMAVASSKALNSQCKQSLVEAWRIAGSGGLSLKIQQRMKSQLHCHDLSAEIKTQKGRIKKLSTTISNSKGFKGRSGLHCVGGVNKIQRSAKNAGQNIAQLFPGPIHTVEAEKKERNCLKRKHSTQ